MENNEILAPCSIPAPLNLVLNPLMHRLTEQRMQKKKADSYPDQQVKTLPPKQALFRWIDVAFPKNRNIHHSQK